MIPLVPRSLLARTFLLIAMVLITAIAAWLYIFLASEREPRARQLAHLVVSIVNITRAAIVNAQPELRRDLLVDLSDREGIRVYPAESTDRTEPLPQTPEIRIMADEVRRDLGSETRFAAAREGIEAFWVSFKIDDDTYWVSLPSDRLDLPRTRAWIGWGAVALALALAGAFLIVYRIRRPLNALAAAARLIGQGKRPEPLTESGPEELQAMSRAFNQMSHDLGRLDEDRALILAGVSHDLRTPLARMRLEIEMLSATENTKSGMAADIDDMDRIIGQFLDFARTEGGEQPVPTDLSQLASSIASHYRDRGLPVIVEIQPSSPANVRPLAIRRLISNLIDNALRYAGTSIDVAVRTADEQVLIEVMDRGPGIPPAEVDRLKQPFTRMESARSNAAGSGLGLAIVDRIVRMHHGRFDLLPREGGGLIARVSFPPVPALAR